MLFLSCSLNQSCIAFGFVGGSCRHCVNMTSDVPSDPIGQHEWHAYFVSELYAGKYLTGAKNLLTVALICAASYNGKR